MGQLRVRLLVVLLGLGVGLQLGSSEMAQAQVGPPDPKPVDPALQAAAFDVIIVPRAGRGQPRLLTERGWRTLEAAPARRAANGRRFDRRPSAYGQRWGIPREVRPWGAAPPPGLFERRPYWFDERAAFARAPRWFTAR